MENQEWRFIDKSDWLEGPWKDEPDKIQWTDEATGLPCLIVRNPGGALCGYVGVAPGHAWYGRSCSDESFDIHGGLTFAAGCSEDGHICHVGDGHDPRWWLGFDCAHAGDYMPKWARMYQKLKMSPSLLAVDFQEKYRDIAYVKAECASLAKQLVDTK